MCSQGILDLLETGQRKGFYKELFALNARLDIHIDEEGFDREETLKLLGGDNNLKENIDSDLFEKVEICVENKRDQYKSIDTPLHQLWKKFVHKQAPGIKEKEFKYDLRIRGICLLLVIKYARALLLSDPLRENLSDHQDALARFASASLSYLYNPDSKNTPDLSKESTYLQVLLLLECAACASPEATIGFLNLADSAAPSKKTKDVNKREQAFYEEFKGVIPYFSALVEFNKAVAYTHINKRDKALENVNKSIGSVRKILKKNHFDQEYKRTLRLYLELPALHQRADLFNKMQCCINAIETIDEINNIIKTINKEKVKKYDATYKWTRAQLLKTSCWLDMGDKESAISVLRDISERRISDELIPKKIKKGLFNRENAEVVNGIEFNKKDYKVFLKDKPTIRTDALKLILQWDLDTWGKSTHKYEAELGKAEYPIKSLNNFISVYKSDRFQRQNLKELAVDWLEVFSRINSVLKITQKKETKVHSIISRKWCRVIENILDCLGDLGSENGKLQVEIEGDISNEIWGDNFKYLNQTIVERLLKLVTNFTDHCEGFFHDDKQHKSNNGNACNYSEANKILIRLAKFEMKILGLDVNNPGKFLKQTDEEDMKVYPALGTYKYRSAMRRERVLREYLKHAKKGKINCIGNCYKAVKENFVWLNEGNENGREKRSLCLERLQEVWKAGEKPLSKEIKGVKTPTLRLEDYGRIISDSDFNIRLEKGRSEQPVYIFETKNEDTKEQTASVEFVSLRRWNSYTPEISFSKGGGYFMFVPYYREDNEDETAPGGIYRTTRLGIVVDPGFDFIHNFFSQGFTLDDIDIVLITHADADHISDFGGLADLLRESEKRGKGLTKKIYTFLPSNAHKVLNRYIEEEAFRRLYYDTVIIDKDKKMSPTNVYLFEKSNQLTLRNGYESDGSESISKEGPCLKVVIEPVQASHDDHVGENGSFGYVLSFKRKHGENYDDFAVIGFTGDSQWFHEYADHFKKCDLVCSHLGSVLGEKGESYSKDKLFPGAWESLIRKKNHPYLPGEILFLEQLRKQGEKDVPNQRIVVLSEFGEEMKGLIRKDLCERLNRCLVSENGGCWSDFVNHDFSQKVHEKECKKCKRELKKISSKGKSIRVIPADVGLRISVRKNEMPMVHCVMCDQFYKPDDTKWVSHGSEEAMFYVCGPCFRSKTRDMRIAKYESILELGRPTRRSSHKA